MSENIINWMFFGEKGMSSECMAAVAMGKDGKDRWGWINHPHDPADLNRCIKLVKAAPEVRESFQKIAMLSPQWKAVIENWDALIAMFHAEAGENWSKQKSAKKTYDYMQQLFRREDGAP